MKGSSSELEFFAIRGNIVQANDFVESFMLGCGFQLKEILSMVLAVEEAVTNIVMHGYRGINGNISLKADFDGSKVTITIEDSGVPFDPMKSKISTVVDDNGDQVPSIKAGLEDRPIGGLGIHLIKSSVDDVEYTFYDGKNSLKLMKSFVPATNAV
jgi:anti-sigma regulatory factor (Ser/Thr protein kinase)